MNRIDTFNLFITKYIIPLAYDESLSYYEQLIRISDKLNEAIKSQNNVIEQFLQLKEWIDTQLIISLDNKLDEWLETGDLSKKLQDYINSIIDPFMEQTNIKLSQQDTNIEDFKTDTDNNITTFKVTVNQELNKSNNQLNGRIDNIIATSGSGKDSELTDLRTTTEGIIYSSAETRVNNIEKMITLNSSNSHIPVQNNVNVLNNLFNGEFEKGYIDDNGSIIEGYAHTTQFIDVIPNTFIYVYGAMGNAIACYTSTGVFLRVLRVSVPPTTVGFNINVPSNVYKIKCNINTSKIAPSNFVILRAQFTNNSVIIKDDNIYTKLNQVEIDGKRINKNTIYPYSILGVEVNGNLCDDNLTIFNGNAVSFGVIDEDDIRCKCTDFMKINDINRTYTVMSPTFERFAILFNENKDFIATLSLASPSEDLERVTTTIAGYPDAYYVRFNFKFVERPIYPIVINGRVTSYDNLDYKNTSSEIKVYDQVKNISGKRWLFIGDSITEHNYRATKNYDQFLEEWLGIESINVAKSGTGVTYPFGDNPSWLDALPTYPNNIDVISVMGALNDRHTPLGKWGDKTSNTVYGGVYLFFNNLINKYPLKQIVYITSSPRDYCWGEDGQYIEWVYAFIKTAKNFSIPVLDLYSHSGLRPWNDENNKEYFSSDTSPNGDGVHPNAKGQQIMAQKIYDFIKQNIITGL